MDDQSQPERSGPGRPPKPGLWIDVHYKLPERLARLVGQDAALQKVSRSDLVAGILAAYYSGEGAMPKAG